MTRLNRDQVLNLAVYAVMLTLALAFVLGTQAYTGRLRLVPLVIGIPTIVLLVFITIAELSPGLAKLLGAKGGSEDDAPPETDGTRVDAGRWQRVVLIYGWIAGYFGVTFVFGFYIAIPAFLIAFFIFESRLSLRTSVLATAGLSVPLYILFRIILDIPLWSGILPQMIPHIIGGGSIPPLYRGL